MSQDPSEATLMQFVGYFLQLGTLGFGGPVALANYMRRDLVEQRHWLTSEEYDEGLAIATACPGPLAYQLGIYCGYLRHGIIGGLAVAIAFGFSPFILVTLAAYFYTSFQATWQLRALFYGVGPVVVALILKACWNLGQKTLKKERLAWIFSITTCTVTLIVQKELTLLFLIAGLLGIFLFTGIRQSQPPTEIIQEQKTEKPKPAGMLLLGLSPITTSKTAFSLFIFFLKTGLFVFGSGLVIVPFLKTYVVDQYHWLGNREFLDAVAIGMISPGPVVITATFVGFLLDGFRGAVAATLGIFTPSVLFTVLATPILRRYRKNPRLQGFIRGVTVAVVGVLVGTTYLVAKSAIGDLLTLTILVTSLIVVFTFKKLPEPILVLAGALIGLIAYQIIKPEWVLK